MAHARTLLVVCLAVVFAVSAPTGAEITYQVITDFGTSDGIYVSGRLVREADGSVYGTTQGGGAHNMGTVFRVDPYGVRTTLHSFSGPDGAYPNGGLTKGPDGQFYGTTHLGGDHNVGTIFRISAEGVFIPMLSFEPALPNGIFSTGSHPFGGLTVGPDSALYGVAAAGGGSASALIFRFTVSRDFRVEHVFGDSPRRGGPNGWLALGPDGALYGATEYGTVDPGGLFRFDVSTSTVRDLYRFAAESQGVPFPEGYRPSGPLAIALDGSIYGANQGGGPNGTGTVFRLGNTGIFSVLHAFRPADATGTYPDGHWPSTGLTEGADGHFYGTADGWSESAGTLFRIDSATGAFSVVQALDYRTTGRLVRTPLTLGGDGRLYGGAQSGGAAGAGTLFAYDPWTGAAPAILHTFSNMPPSAPSAGLTKASDERLYGTAAWGGGWHGGVFRLEPNGTRTLLHQFSGWDGSHPESELTEGPDGALYGVTESGGDQGAGVIFRITPHGVFTRLHSFAVGPVGECPEGCHPQGPLAFGPDRGLYGTTVQGGEHGGGVLFRVTTDGVLTIRHAFAPLTDGYASRGGLVVGSDGRLYGTASLGGPYGGGTVFAYDSSGSLTILHPFGHSDSQPVGPLVQGADGVLYGTTLGGAGGGTVFRVDPLTRGHHTLHRFNDPPDGAYSSAGLVQGTDGAFYGVTSHGGADPAAGDSGTIFRVTAAGEFRVLRTFNSLDGGGHHAKGRLLETEPGVFYGTTAQGGPTGLGTVFRLAVPLPPVNTPPGANNGAVSTLEDTPVSGFLSAGDVDGDPLVFSLVSTGALGTAVITNATTGAFTYTPSPDAHGTDTFTFRANDGKTDSNIATVTVTIVSVNDAPVAQNGALAVAAGGSASGTLVATDIDTASLTYAIVVNGSKGTAVVTNASTGAYTYTANAGTSGTDTFTFRANDGELDSNTATVTVTIAASGNRAPIASDAALTTTEDRSASGTLSATDPDRDRLTFRIVANGTLGTATISNTSTGRFTYVPQPDRHGVDQFTFVASDGRDDSNVATVTVTITPVNDAPVAQSASYTTARNTAVTGILTAVDVDGDPLQFAIAKGPRRGTVVITDAATGAFVFTPAAGFTGNESFTFTASDGSLTSRAATVTITVGP